MIEELIDSLENDEQAVLMHPVTSQSLSATQGFFLKKELSGLPDDYIEFLHLTNGLVYGYISLYGTNAVEEERMLDLVTANEKFLEEYDDKKLLLLGHNRSSLLVYNRETELYEIVDQEELEMVDEFEDFEEMLSEFFEGDGSFARDEDDDYMFEDDYED